MGYDLHICRRQNWQRFDSDISLEEWLAVCAANPMLEAIEGDAAVKTPDGLILSAKVSAPRVRWFDPANGTTFAWFHFRRGQITVSNAGPPTIAMMCDLAARLGGRVQGDEGEFYNPDGSTFSA